MCNCFSKQKDLKQKKIQNVIVSTENSLWRCLGSGLEKSDFIIFPFLNEASETWACKWLPNSSIHTEPLQPPLIP